jgi:hypothetical protein
MATKIEIDVLVVGGGRRRVHGSHCSQREGNEGPDQSLNLELERNP